MTQPENMGDCEGINSEMAQRINHLLDIRYPIGESGTRCFEAS